MNLGSPYAKGTEEDLRHDQMGSVVVEIFSRSTCGWWRRFGDRRFVRIVTVGSLLQRKHLFYYKTGTVRVKS